MKAQTRKAAGKASLDPLVRRRMAQNIAGYIGTFLRQTYEMRDGAWWLVTNGKPARPLKPDEVAWHTERNHAPFVAGGAEQGDPRWWDDPPNVGIERPMKPQEGR
jgi:hypothetical protein